MIHLSRPGTGLIFSQQVDRDRDGAWEATPVLDWKEAFAWSRYADIGNLLRYQADASSFALGFQRGYTEGGTSLPPDWRMLARIEDLAALLDMLRQSTPKTRGALRTSPGSSPPRYRSRPRKSLHGSSGAVSGFCRAR